MDVIAALLLLAIAATILLLWAPRGEPKPGQTVSGFARVLDGDSVQIGSARYRIAGIDAPEWNQSERLPGGGVLWTGRAASNALAARLHLRRVRARIIDRDVYGRWIATLWVGDDDIGAWMVEQGHAMAYCQYSCEYLAEESYARKHRLGLWRAAGAPYKPWDWRRQNLHVA